MMLMRTLLRFLDDDGGIDVCFEEAIADAGEWPEVSLQFDGCWFTECFLTFVIIRAQDSVFHQLNKLKEINSLTKESNLLIFFCPPEKRWSISHRERTANFSVSLLTMVWLLQQICADVCVCVCTVIFFQLCQMCPQCRCWATLRRGGG